MLFELLTGHRPWEADSAAAVAMARLAGPPPDPSTLRSGIPADLVAIDRKALATEPADRWSSAAAFAAALEAFLAGTAVPGMTGVPGVADPTIATNRAGLAGAAAAGAAGLAATSATARPNPGAIPYVPDAYADEPRPRSSDPYPRSPASPGGRGGGPARPPVRPLDEEDEPGGTSPAVWAAGIVALLILAAVAFLVFRLLSGPGATPVAQVTVPNFVGQPLPAAQALAAQNGIVLDSTATAPAPSGVPPSQVLAQDPPAGTKIDKGGTVKLTIAVGPTTIAVPDLRGRTEIEAFNLLITARLQPGSKTEAFDPIVPAGSVISQNPAAGVLVNEGTPIAYVLSKGPEPSPSPSPSPSPTPTPTPTPPPTPPPTPTPTPTPAPIPVGDYRCMTVADAKSQIASDGFSVKVLPAAAPDEWIVSGQSPDAETNEAPGSQVTISAQEVKPGDCP